MARRPIVCVVGGSGAPVGIQEPEAVAVAGFAEALAQRQAGRDLVLLAAEGSLSDGWLAALERAAYSDSTLASATALAAPVVSPLELHPRVPLAAAHCSWLRADALELVGPVASLAEFSARAGALGLGAVLADGAALSGTADRWPRPGAADPPRLARTLAAARLAAGEPLSVTIDARALGDGRIGGTQTYIRQLVLALARLTKLRVLVAHAQDAAGLDVDVITYEEATRGVELTDIVHRPQQVFTLDDLALMRLVGRRVVITHQDLIAYRMAAYHDGEQRWLRYRQATRVALAAADAVVFFSEHALRDAVAEDLLEVSRGAVVGACIDAVAAEPALVSRPQGVPEGRFVLQLGADYCHKNRRFALRLGEELQALGWPGTVLFAGPHAEHGGDGERPPHALGTLSDAEREWLYSHADALLYPSTYEGFGLLPYEAAARDLPCIFAPVAALAEIAEAAVITPWDARASAQAALGLLSPGPERSAHVANLRAAAGRWSWERVAGSLLELYGDAVSSRPPGGALLQAEQQERDVERTRLSADAQELRRRTEHGRALIDADEGLLSLEQQLGLARVLRRGGPVARALLRPIGALGRVRRR